MKKKTGRRAGLAAVLLMTMILAMTASAADTGKDNKAVKKTGVVTEGGKTSIYTKAGKLVKGVPAYKIKVDGKTCYYTIDKKGNATKLSGLEQMAAKRLVAQKAGGKKSKKNLKKAFRWSAKLKYRSNTRKLKGKKAAEYYGKYGFKNRMGDCNTAAYTFYWMAKVLGYSPKVVQGHVPSGSINNLKNHTWVTIKIKKTTYYFDPDFNRSYRGKTVRTRSGMKTLGKDCGFMFKYGTPGTYMYKK